MAKTMTATARAARNEYKRKWAKEHRELVKAQQERYWTKRAAMKTIEAEQSNVSATIAN